MVPGLARAKERTKNELGILRFIVSFLFEKKMD
jgi:hypothetical protein